MRKLLLLCIMAVPLSLLAEPILLNKEIVCDDATTLISYFISKEGEQPVFVGHVNPSELIVLVNPTTQGWTIIQTNGDKACVIEVGQGFKFREPTTETDPAKLVLN